MRDLQTPRSFNHNHDIQLSTLTITCIDPLIKPIVSLPSETFLSKEIPCDSNLHEYCYLFSPKIQCVISLCLHQTTWLLYYLFLLLSYSSHVLSCINVQCRTCSPSPPPPPFPLQLPSIHIHIHIHIHTIFPQPASPLGVAVFFSSGFVYSFPYSVVYCLVFIPPADPTTRLFCFLFNSSPPHPPPDTLPPPPPSAKHFLTTHNKYDACSLRILVVKYSVHHCLWAGVFGCEGKYHYRSSHSRPIVP